jgi:FkbM family methyltransferase
MSFSPISYRSWFYTLKTLAEATFSADVTLAALRVYLPGPLPIRLSVALGNVRMQRMLSRFLRPGDTVIDVGANIGYNTLFAAACVGPRGRVIAVEPAQDNLTILYANLVRNNLHNVFVLPYAAGAARERKQFFLRGDVSAVNSLYQENFYHPITQTVEVLALPLDDLAIANPRLVKIDVEGGELEVLHGMTGLLHPTPPILIVEWHPTLQQAAGHPADALPRYLLDQGFTLQAVSHLHTMALYAADIPALTTHLLSKRSPVELLALSASAIGE